MQPAGTARAAPRQIHAEGGMQAEDRDRLVEETLDKYTRYVNAGLAKLYRFANVMTVEWEARGAVIRDLHGKEYIDCSGGPAVFNVGHRHPKVIAAVKEQLDRMPMSVRAMPRNPEADLAELLAQITPGELQYTFFANSGTEANEGALKLARLATGRTEFVAAEGAFHGKTMGALSASGREKDKAPFQPLWPGVTHGAFTGRPALWKALETNPYLHSSTFGGNPLACAAGIATIRVIQDERLVERAADLGTYLLQRLEALARRHPATVKQVRGKGLLVGVEFTDPDIVLLVTAEALQRGVIVFYSLNNPSTFRLAPPLVITRPQLDWAVEALEEAVAATEALLAEVPSEAQAPS